MRTESPDGEAIGEVDYVIEGENGLEAVIGIGGFLGLGEYTVALPLSDFELNEDYSAFVLGTTQRRAEGAARDRRVRAGKPAVGTGRRRPDGGDRHGRRPAPTS